MPTDRPDSRLYDVRLIGRFLDTGVVTAADQAKFIKKLPDLSEQSQAVEVSPDPRESAPDLSSVDDGEDV